MQVVQVHKDPFSPVLLSSPPLTVTQEQMDLIDAVISVASSDSKFAEKAQKAIRFILTAGKIDPATVTSTTPQSAKVGDPSFLLHVHGTKFDTLAQIVFAGLVLPTTFVSANELTAQVDMTLVTAPAEYPVAVQTGNGVLTPSVKFTVNPPASQLASGTAFKPIAQTEPEHKEKELKEHKEPEKK